MFLVKLKVSPWSTEGFVPVIKGHPSLGFQTWRVEQGLDFRSHLSRLFVQSWTQASLVAQAVKRSIHRAQHTVPCSSLLLFSHCGAWLFFFFWCLTLGGPMYYRLPGSSTRGISLLILCAELIKNPRFHEVPGPNFLIPGLFRNHHNELYFALPWWSSG